MSLQRIYIEVIGCEGQYLYVLFRPKGICTALNIHYSLFIGKHKEDELEILTLIFQCTINKVEHICVIFYWGTFVPAKKILLVCEKLFNCFFNTLSRRKKDVRTNSFIGTTKYMLLSTHHGDGTACPTRHDLVVRFNVKSNTLFYSNKRIWTHVTFRYV